jgi:hypothetical protein
MNTVLSVTKPEVFAFEILETQRNTLLQPSAMYLIQTINFVPDDSKDYNSYSLVGITVFQDCIEVIIFATLKSVEFNLTPIELIAIASDKNITGSKPVYFENPIGLGYTPTSGQEFYPDELGFGIYKPLMMSIPPFTKYSILKQ